MQDNVTQADEDQRLADFLLKEGGEIAHDMAHHVGDQIFEVMKRNGMAQRSEAGTTAMLTIASTMLLEQAIDQCSRAAEDDCRGAVVRMFRAQLSSETRDAIDDAGIDVSDIRERTDFTGGEVGKYASTAQPEVKGLVEALEGMVRLFPEAYDVLTAQELRGTKGNLRSLIDQQSKALFEMRKALAAYRETQP